MLLIFGMALLLVFYWVKYHSLACLVARADRAYNNKEYEVAFRFYTDAALVYKLTFHTKTEQASAGKRNWHNVDVPFEGSHTYNRLGFMLSNGLGCSVDKEAASQYYMLAEENCGSADAQVGLGLLFLEGGGVVKNDEVAIKYFTMAADQGHPEALFQLGEIYKNGTATMRELSKARRYYERAMECGCTNAAYQLALILISEENWKEVVLHLETAIEGKHPAALSTLGCMYLKGKGVVKDLTLAFQYLLQAAELGDPNGSYLLALLYLREMKDEKRALELLRKSAQLGHSNAMYQLGKQLCRGPDKDILESLRLLNESAKKGNKKARAFLRKATNKI